MQLAACKQLPLPPCQALLTSAESCNFHLYSLHHVEPLLASPAGDASVDVAVFCLALMGRDYGTFLEEACRVLRPGGHLWVAEVTLEPFYAGEAAAAVTSNEASPVLGVHSRHCTGSTASLATVG